jgi:hypothetical protein
MVPRVKARLLEGYHHGDTEYTKVKEAGEIGAYNVGKSALTVLPDCPTISTAWCEEFHATVAQRFGTISFLFPTLCTLCLFGEIVFAPSSSGKRFWRSAFNHI